MHHRSTNRNSNEPRMSSTRPGRRSNERRGDDESRSSSGFCFKFLVLVLGLILAIAFATMPIFSLKSPLKASFVKLSPVPAPVGNLAPNDRLSKANYLAYGNVWGPETIVFSSNGSMYTGLANGCIVRLDNQGNVHNVVRIGDEKNETLCNDLSTGMKASCGRPLGLRIRPNTDLLYVADSYNGIFTVNLKSGQKNVLIHSSDPRFGLQPMKLVNDLVFDGDHSFYFIDSSNERTVQEAIEELFEANARGRLFRFDERTNQLEFVLENLYFPNGIEMLPSRDSLLINECTMSRIIRYYISGPKKGEREVWAELPGYGDTLRLTEKNTILAPIAGSRYGKYPSLLDLLGEYPVVRTFLSAFLNIREVFMKLPKYGLLVEYDLNGQPIRSWHDPKGERVEATTNAIVRDGKVYVGSFYHPFIAVFDY